MASTTGVCPEASYSFISARMTYRGPTVVLTKTLSYVTAKPGAFSFLWRRPGTVRAARVFNDG